MRRRDFIRKTLMSGAALSVPYVSFGKPKDKETKLTILHTNDVHSHIDPLTHFKGFSTPVGGASARASIIKKIREEEEFVLLFDAGDIFQGTPYFNLYKGDLEIELMNQMGYDAVTIGNHDFDAGLENLSKQIDRSSFPFLNANYSFSQYGLKERVKPYQVFEKGPLRIGVFGLGVELNGLVPASLFGETNYLDPISIAQETEWHLKKNLKCDYIVCLSHLGFEYMSKKVSDKVLASQTKYIDLVIGGHTHSFLDVPYQQENILGNMVLINQVGWAGVILGRIDVVFSKKLKKNCASGNTVIHSEKSIRL